MSLKNTSENFEKVWHVRIRKSLIFIEPTDIWGHRKIDIERGLLRGKLFEVMASFKKGGSDPNQIDNEESGKGYGSEKEVIGELVHKKTGAIYKMSNKLMVIGRGEECDIRIEDPTVSRKHASIGYHWGKAVIEDLGSKSGTIVNHERILKKILKDTDTIRIGLTELMFWIP